MRRPDFSKVIILHINSSALGIGAIHGQLDEEGKDYVIAYASQSNNKVESNYSSYEGECLVVVWAIIHFKPYLYGTKFNLYTDHQPIKWLMTNDKLIGKLTHWVNILHVCEFKVIHRRGITHQNVDTMSQRPLTTFEDFSEATSNTDSLDSPQPGLGGSHHLPPYSILCASPRHLHPNGFLSRESQGGVPKLSRFGLSGL